MKQGILIVMSGIYSAENVEVLRSKVRRIFGHLSNEIPILQIGISDCAGDIVRENLRVVRIAGRSGNLVFDFLRSVSAQWRIVKRITAGHKPVVFAGHSLHGMMGVLIALRLRCPYLTHIIGDSVAFKRIKFKPLQCMWRKVAGYIEDAIRRNAAVVLVHSTFLQKLAIESAVPNECILFIPRVVDSESDIMTNRYEHTQDVPVFNDTDANNDIKILAAARLVADKGVDIILQSLGKLFKQSPSLQKCTKLFVAGDGPMRQTLEEQANYLGLKESVSFLGFISHTELLALYKRVDIFVQTSIVREGLGMSTQEACWAGLPVIASNLGGIPNLVKHGNNGLLVPPGDARALAEALLLLIESPEMRKTMGERSRVIEAEYSRNRTDGLEELKCRILAM